MLTQFSSPPRPSGPSRPVKVKVVPRKKAKTQPSRILPPRVLPTSSPTQKKISPYVSTGKTKGPDKCVKGQPCGYACIDTKNRCYDGVANDTPEGRALNKVTQLIGQIKGINPPNSAPGKYDKGDIISSLRSIEDRQIDPTTGKAETDQVYQDRRKAEKIKLIGLLKKDSPGDYTNALNILLNSDDSDDVDILNGELNGKDNKIDYSNLRIDLFDRLDPANDKDKETIGNIDADIEANLSTLGLSPADPDYEYQKNIVRGSLLRTYQYKDTFDKDNPSDPFLRFDQLNKELDSDLSKFDRGKATGSIGEYNDLRTKSLGLGIRAINARALSPNSSAKAPDPTNPTKYDNFNNSLDEFLTNYYVKNTKAGIYFDRAGGDLREARNPDGTPIAIISPDKITNPETAAVSSSSFTAEISTVDKKVDANRKMGKRILDSIAQDAVAAIVLSPVVKGGKTGGTNSNEFTPVERERFKYLPKGSTTAVDVSYVTKMSNLEPVIDPKTGKQSTDPLTGDPLNLITDDHYRVRLSDESISAKKKLVEKVTVGGKKQVNAVTEYILREDPKDRETIIIKPEYYTSSNTNNLIKNVTLETISITDSNGVVVNPQFSHYSYNRSTKEYNKVFALTTGGITAEYPEPLDQDTNGETIAPIAGKFIDSIYKPSQKTFYSKYKNAEVKTQELDPEIFLDAIADYIEKQTDPNLPLADRKLNSSFDRKYKVSDPSDPSKDKTSAQVAREIVEAYKTKIKDPNFLTSTMTMQEKLETITDPIRNPEFTAVATMMKDAVNKEGQNALTEQLAAIAFSTAGNYPTQTASTNLVNTINGSPTPRIDLVVSDSDNNYNISVKKGDGQQADFSAAFKDTFRDYDTNSGFINFVSNEAQEIKEVPDKSTQSLKTGQVLERDFIEIANGGLTSPKNVFSNSTNYDGSPKTGVYTTVDVDSLLETDPTDPGKRPGVEKFIKSLKETDPQKIAQARAATNAFVDDITGIDQILRSGASPTEKENLLRDILSSLSGSSSSILGSTSSGYDTDLNHMAQALFINRLLQQIVASDQNNIQYNNGTDTNTIKENNFKIESNNFSTYTATEFDFSKPNEPDSWVIDPGSIDLPFRRDRGPFQYKNYNPSDDDSTKRHTREVELKGTYKKADKKTPIGGGKVNVPINRPDNFLDKTF